MDSTNDGNYYVYALAHADYGLFYIGKGCGARVTEHELDAMSEKIGRSAKIDALKAIKTEGGMLTRYLVATDLSEAEAYRIESILIAFSTELKTMNLTTDLRNIAKGHGAETFMLKGKRIDMMNAEPAVLGSKRLLLLSINREFAPFFDYAAELPGHVAGRWVVSPEKAGSCDYVLACTRRRIVGIYNATDWKAKPEDGDKGKRYVFEGKPANDDFAEGIRYRLLPQDVAFGNGNPVKYYP